MTTNATSTPGIDRDLRIKLYKMSHHALSIKVDLMMLYTILSILEDFFGRRPTELAQALDSLSKSANQIYIMTDEYSAPPKGYNFEDDPF